MMRLTEIQNGMLEGKYGFPAQKSMEILVGLGECYDAEEMIPVTSVHLLASAAGAGKAGSSFIKELAEKGGRFIPATHTNLSSIDSELWMDLAISEADAHEQMAMTEALEKMGAFLSHTCTPFLAGHVPRLGEHVAWTESAAIVYANSVLGCRTNREGVPTALAAALTGVVPAYGYHLDQNRYGTLKIQVTTELAGLHDYGTLGYFAGKLVGDGVPVFAGIASAVTSDELKFLGATAATSGSVALYHVVGVTPEAPTVEAAFGRGKVKDWRTVEFGRRELQETEESLSKATAKQIDLVIFGCPHVSISEIRDLARLLSGKKLKSTTELWILTSQMVKAYAKRMGYLDAIQASGARIVCETCPLTLPRGHLKARGYKTAATNSAKMAYFLAGVPNVLSYYGSAERCIEAAISGVWR